MCDALQPMKEVVCFQSVHLTGLTLDDFTFTDFCANLLHNWLQPGADWDGLSSILNTTKSCEESCCVTI